MRNEIIRNDIMRNDIMRNDIMNNDLTLDLTLEGADTPSVFMTPPTTTTKSYAEIK